MSVAYILNVGHGDSIVVQLQDGGGTSWGVIDCHNPHPGQDSPTLLFLKNQGVTHLDFICLTHPDLDHFSGIRQLLNYFSSDGRTLKSFYIPTLDFQIYQSVLTSERKARVLQELYALLLDLVDQNRVELVQVGYGTLLAEQGLAFLKSLGPYGKDLISYVKDVRRRLHDAGGLQAASPNKNLLSVVTALECKDSTILLCSDASKKSIEYSIKKWAGDRKKRGLGVRFQFVKVSHHGSRTNNHDGLWKDFTIPKISSAAISAGGRFGLPNKESVCAITDAGVKLYCTTRSGCLSNLSQNMPQPVRNPSISAVVSLGLDMVSTPAQDFKTIPPLHGNISFVVDDQGFRVHTEQNVAPITEFP
jgi:beta-lactamase superfamily II metal-dependent hydrolase